MNGLQPYAAHPATSRGRLHPEPEAEFRNPYQRDRDRVIHSSAFRRLEYKTQVFVNHEGDMFRTRLTHSMEVAQIGRTVARALGLNEDLTEAICLAHDLGHTPFGHAGQDALDRCMREYGGFEHNLQSLRVVDVLEERYAAFPGLNLTFETREGILKHCSRAKAQHLGELGRRFLEEGQPGLEAQVANLADEIAYNNHDVDDGLRAGLITVGQLQECRLFADQMAAVRAQWPELPERRLVHELVRRMINLVVSDLVATSRARIAELRPPDIDAVRAAGRPLIALSDAVREQHVELKRFLNQWLYRHYRVQRMSYKAERIVMTLFETFMGNELLLPHDVQERIARLDPAHKPGGRARLIADYIAGMTDRYAIAEYQRVTDPERVS
jgi:dGTPase